MKTLITGLIALVFMSACAPNETSFSPAPQEPTENLANITPTQIIPMSSEATDGDASTFVKVEKSQSISFELPRSNLIQKIELLTTSSAGTTFSIFISPNSTDGVNGFWFEYTNFDPVKFPLPAGKQSFQMPGGLVINWIKISVDAASPNVFVNEIKFLE